MSAKSKSVWVEIPRSAALHTVPSLPRKIPWDGVPYDTPADVLPWLQDAFREAMKANPTWSKSGIPVGYEGPYFSLPEHVGHFQVVGANQNRPPYVVWFSPYTNTQWSMYLEVVSVKYKGTRPVKNG